MSSYLTSEQTAQLLRGINPKRVGKDGKGFSHVEAYDIRAHLTRIFGFGRWGVKVTSLDLVFEGSQMLRRKNKQGQEYGDPYEAWTVCYRATVELTVNAPDGTHLATYGDGATGEATNQPSRGDAHDLAMKTALSQALKRCAVNLGDNFGLSLYAKGSTAALVRKTLVSPDTAPSEDAVDSHITQQLPREDEAAEPVEDPRSTNHQTPAAPTPPDVAAGHVEGGVAPVAPPSTPSPDPEKEQAALQVAAERIRELALGDPEKGYTAHRWFSHLVGMAIKEKVLTVPVESSLSPNRVPLKVLLDECMKTATDRERQARAS